MHFTNRQLPAVARALIERLWSPHEPQAFDRAAVLALSGDLGVGKTTLVQHIAQALGIKRLVASPTFIIMRSYPCEHPRFKRLVHIDAYRLDTEAEIAPLKLGDVFADPEALVCVEWPEKLGDALPRERIEARLFIEGEYARELISDAKTEDSLQLAIQVV